MKIPKTLKDDTQYQVGKLIEYRDDSYTTGSADNPIQYWEITTDYGSMCVPKIKGFIPKKGMICHFYGKGIGMTVRGVTIGGRVSFYRTAEEEEVHFQEEQEKSQQKKRDNFIKHKAEMDIEVNKLPKVFQERIERFRNNNENFRWEYEGYELFACQEAVKIANTLHTVKAIDEFKNMNYDEQKKLVDINDGHSGNTFGCSILLATVFISHPELVSKVHGAMCPLVGCEDYGCYSGGDVLETF